MGDKEIGDSLGPDESPRISSIPETPAADSRGWRKTFRAFSYRDYRLLWSGSFTSSCGTWMQEVAQNWLIFDMTRSAFWLGLDAFLGDAPFILFSLIGGVVADRYDRRKILLCSQIVQLTNAFALGALVWFHQVQIWHILLLSFLTGVAQSFGGPAYQALIPSLVEREDMPNAIALNSIQFNMAITIGPALGGLALSKLGEAWCFGLNALSFVAPIITLSMISARFLPVKTSDSILSSLKQGLNFIRDRASMAALTVLAFCITFLAMPLRTFIPVFVKGIFQRGPETYGNLLSIMGIGTICGSLLVAGMGNMRHKGRFALIVLICLGAGTSAFSLSHWLPLTYGVLLLVGAFMMALFATTASLVQLITTDDMRGRVMSVYNCAFRGGMPMGNMVSGWLVPKFTAPIVLGVNGLLLMALGLFFLLFERRVAKL